MDQGICTKFLLKNETKYLEMLTLTLDDSTLSQKSILNATEIRKDVDNDECPGVSWINKQTVKK